ncbi:MAG: aconitate hydratase [Peptococcaceae bacterium BICA1-8]|nr:MAG: aconitate hydratase [Peptococcaceae bacterium BICA1-8]
MGHNIFEKIIISHGIDLNQQELPLIPDQVLTQDATATPVFLQVEAMGLNEVKPFVVSYLDHNTLQIDNKNPDDHLYLQGIAKKLGANLSRPGNGICHQVHLENFAKPGGILLGSDSHTPTAGAAGMLGIGAGGLDVAVAIAGEPYFVPKPQVVGVKLIGELPLWSTAKDIILSILKEVTVKGGVGKVFEYFGEGVKTLSVYERATICNMGAEMGATSSLFPSDEITFRYLKSLGRSQEWLELKPDFDAKYEKIIEIDLSGIEPMVALPHSPDNVRKVSELAGTPLFQVAIGSCTNSSYKDMAVAAGILKGKKIAESVSLVISPGSRRILSKMSETGVLKDLVDAGARILEATCGPCNGIGQAPAAGTNSLRTYNRNYQGRSGTKDANVFLASPETAAVSAIFGYITDPREMGDYPEVDIPENLSDNGNLLISAQKKKEDQEVIKGPNIKPMPVGEPLEGDLTLQAALIAGDNVSTDDILPGGANMLALRSNIPASVPFAFSRMDKDFSKKIEQFPKTWVVVGGENYGQGSSREHAVMVPMSIGMKAVLVKSFARIYRKNLINYGVIPLTFVNRPDYDKVSLGDVLLIADIKEQIKSPNVMLFNQTKGISIEAQCSLSEREAEILLAGGLLNYVKNKLVWKD